MMAAIPIMLKEDYDGSRQSNCDKPQQPSKDML